MKKVLTTSFLLIAIFLNGQTLEEKINDLTTKIATTLNKKGAIKIAVYPFSYLKHNEQDLAFDVRFDVHDKLTEKGRVYKVMDRGTFDTYAKEHQLNAEGLIDEATAKQFGKLIAADAYVTGKVYMFGSVIRIRIKVTDTETGEILSMQSEKLPVDYDMALFLELENWKENKQKAAENKSQNPNCATENVGDYLFYNNTNDSYEIRLKNALGGGFYGTTKRIVLSPNSKSGFKDLKSGSYVYDILKKDGIVGLATKYKMEFSGEFTIKKCEAKLQNINAKSTERQTVYTPNSTEKLVTLSIKNPNFYAREVILTNNLGAEIPVRIGSQSTSSVEINKGYYKFQSKTVFTKVVVEQTAIQLDGNITLTLAKDYKN